MTDIDPALRAALNEPMTTPGVLAKALGVSLRTAHRLLDRGDVPSVRVMSLRRVQTAHIRKMIGMDDPSSVPGDEAVAG